MDPKKFAVDNQTRESNLSPSVTLVNAALEPLKVLKVLIEGLPPNSRTGLWLTNFKGVPVARTLSPFDLIYLDKDQRVIHAIELSKDGEFAPPKGTPTSALVLPPKSLSASKTRTGDQLTFGALEQIAPPPAPAQEVPHPSETATLSTAPSEAIAAQPSPGSRFFSPAKRTPLTPPDQSTEVGRPIETAPASAPIADAAPGHPAPEKFPDILRSAPASSSTEARSMFSFPAIEAAPKEPPAAQPLPSSSVDQSSLVPASESAPPSFETQPTPLPPVAPANLSITEAPSEYSVDSSESPLVAPSRVIEHPPAPPQATDAWKQAVGQKRKYSWKVRMLRWIFPDLIIKEPEQQVDRRRASRQSLPGLIAYYFTGGTPEPQKISNISVTGFYLQTEERWMPGTIVRMTLQRIGTKGDDPSDIISVNSRIVRWGEDGEGFEFILADPDE
jgi:hypothetical protein